MNTSEDIHYLLLCEGTLLKPKDPKDFRLYNGREGAIQKANDELSAAAPNDSTAIAMAAVRYSHALSQTSQSKDIEYTVDDKLLDLLKQKYVGKYKIGVVVSNKTSAKAALGKDAEILDAIININEIDSHSLYFSDYAVIVIRQTMAKAMMPGVDYVHQYKNAEKLDEYLESPKLSWNYADADGADVNDPVSVFVIGAGILILLGATWVLYMSLSKLFM